jgi:predicted LPLAT superfamily acyltransferase
MKALLIHNINRASILFGDWVIRFIAWWIATGYFFFRPERLKSSLRLYQVIFPDKSRWHHFYYAWRQFHGFAASYSDRIKMSKGNGLSIISEGSKDLLKAAKEEQGGIIITSHLGNYEIAASSFQEIGLKLMLMMGEKEAKRVASEQRESLESKGISIHVSSAQEDSPLSGLEAIKFLKDGGFVSIAGDVVWTDLRSQVAVKLFGHEVRVPSAPYLLAMISGAPVFTLLTVRLGKGKHKIVLSPLRMISAASRADRKAAIQASAQEYANALEKAIRTYPYQWYIFEPIFDVDEGETRSQGSTGAQS